MALVTVIVPIFKVEKYIYQCVDSILTQSFRNFDLVLVDDGSPDACPQICDTYAEKDGRIKVIHKQNGGLSDARNAGIDWAMEHSDSDWLAFVDSDDYLHPDYLQTLYDTAIKESADLVICDYFDVNEDGIVKENDHGFSSLVTEEKNKLFEYLCLNWRIVTAWNKLYQKHLFEDLRFVPGKIHEDSFAIHHVLWNCRRAAIIPDGLYYYRHRNNSIMATESPKSMLDGLEALAEQCEFGMKHDISPLTTKIPVEYFNKFKEKKASFDKEEKLRYKQLKNRLARVYFRRIENRNLKRWFGFRFAGIYCKLSSFFKNAR